jgi:hypothetical protein
MPAFQSGLRAFYVSAMTPGEQPAYENSFLDLRICYDPITTLTLPKRNSTVAADSNGGKGKAKKDKFCLENIGQKVYVFFH